MTAADRARPAGRVTVSEGDAGGAAPDAVGSEGFIVAPASVPYGTVRRQRPDPATGVGVMVRGEMTQRLDDLRPGSLAVVAAGETDAADAGGGRQAGQRLRTTLGRAGHPLIRFARVETPIGPVFVGATEAGVCDVSFGRTSEQDYRHALRRRAEEVRRDDFALAEAASQIEAYFNGSLRQFSLPLDLRQATPFTARVLSATRTIRFGCLTSYGELAARIGSPGASRAVGGALGRNPIPIIIPCHRVIAQGGRIGGFTGGLTTKRILLAVEGHLEARLTGIPGAANGGGR